MAARPSDTIQTRRRRELITPEGIPIVINIADEGERLYAFIIDVFIIFGTILVLFLLLALGVMGGEVSGWASSFVLISAFLLRNFYFIFFELRWQGATPGKRARGLRVVDRNGGRLSSDAVVARNLVRDLEVFIPVSLLLVPGQLGGPAWMSMAAGMWMLIFLTAPMFNRDRLRVGDLIAGTLVVQTPRNVLLDDLGNAHSRPSEDPGTPEAKISTAVYQFTQAQLDVYGVYELQVLESLLRQQHPNPAETAIETVSDRIMKKIEWPIEHPPADPRQFLEDFYTALRARLEGQMLYGKRREDKHHRE